VHAGLLIREFLEKATLASEVVASVSKHVRYIRHMQQGIRKSLAIQKKYRQECTRMFDNEVQLMIDVSQTQTKGNRKMKKFHNALIELSPTPAQKLIYLWY